MTDNPLPPEFDGLFRAERMGSEDETLVIPPVRPDHTTQEIRTGTQELPILDATVRQPVVLPPSPRYIPPTPRKEVEHVPGERPTNGILGMALSLVVGIVAMLMLVDTVTVDTPKEEK